MEGSGDCSQRLAKTCAAIGGKGELVGLMVVHHILLAVNEVNQVLTGSVTIYSDCLGALDKVKNLPPSRTPTRSLHLDILKNILVNCNDLTFDRYYSHVAAYQYTREDYLSLL